MKRPLIALLALYAAVTLAYGVVNPLFEAPDEHWHYFTAQYIADNGKLPFVAPGGAYDEWLSQEAAQPPLYYLLGGALIAPLDTAQAREQVWLNPFVSIGDAAAAANINRAIHIGWDDWPWRGAALAAHLLRAFSAALGLGTLLCIYGSGRLLWPDDEGKALLAVALAAFLPQFDFVHSAVSNDPLIIFLSSLVIWQLLRLWATAVTRTRLLMLGVTIGLAALAKNAGVLLLLYAIGFLAIRIAADALGTGRLPAANSRNTAFNLQSLLFDFLTLILPVFLIAGWLWLRNRALYGDWTATNQFIRIAGGDRGYTLWQILGESSGLWLSLIAVFGWFNVRAPDWIYWIWSGMTGAAVLAFAVQLKTVKRMKPLSLTAILGQKWLPGALLAVWPLLVYAGLALFMLKTEAAQGRLLLPAILPLSLGLAQGVSRFSNGRWRLVWPGLAFVTTIYALFGVIRPAYAFPEPLTPAPGESQAAVPASAQFGPITFDAGQGKLQLVGVEMPPDQRVVPGGEPVEVVLYWRAESPVEKDYLSSVHLLGRAFESVGSVNRYPAWGMIPTSRWRPGQIWRDAYRVRVKETAVAPAQLRVSVSLYDSEAEKPLPAIWEDGTAVNLLLVGEPARLANPNPPDARHIALDIPFADGITLAGYAWGINSDSDVIAAAPGDALPITLYWQAAAAPTQNYTVFVQLLDADDQWLAGADAPPVNNFFPTAMWQAGDWVDDLHTLAIPADLPPGDYVVRVGMYDPDTGARLARLDGNGDSVDVAVRVKSP